MRFLALLATLNLVLGAQEASAEIRSKALAIHHRLFTLDTHCDTPMRMSDRWDVGVRHEPGKRTSGTQDLVRMKEGGLDASFFAVFVGQGPRTETGNQAAWEKANAVLDRLDRMFAQHSDLC
ncbi:MAG TPA: membrane dipeptidase, partial [Holophaga sp.]|nr:membrane dipeptidase [Holophaga sp.]